MKAQRAFVGGLPDHGIEHDEQAELLRLIGVNSVPDATFPQYPCRVPAYSQPWSPRPGLYFVGGLPMARLDATGSYLRDLHRGDAHRGVARALERAVLSRNKSIDATVIPALNETHPRRPIWTRIESRVQRTRPRAP